MRQARTQLQSRAATRVLLALNGALALLLVMQWSPPASVTAGPVRADRAPGGIINPADQRREMIAELRRVSAKLDALQEAFSKPLEVRVVEMPPGSGD
ncbi:MAG: hypothetical protein D6693_10220 [Planctomycetota bacterium]|nr:MAG: hypothetical protein D6693_10220 [Planctomycetota bacterium]